MGWSVLGMAQGNSGLPCGGSGKDPPPSPSLQSLRIFFPDFKTEDLSTEGVQDQRFPRPQIPRPASRPTQSSPHTPDCRKGRNHQDCPEGLIPAHAQGGLAESLSLGRLPQDAPLPSGFPPRAQGAPCSQKPCSAQMPSSTCKFRLIPLKPSCLPFMSQRSLACFRDGEIRANGEVAQELANFTEISQLSPGL